MVISRSPCAHVALTSHCGRKLGVHLQDALELSKRDMAAEEVELLDVERQMEEELVDEFKQVERVIATRVDAVEGDQRFLVKVRLRGPNPCRRGSEQNIFPVREGQTRLFLGRIMPSRLS